VTKDQAPVESASGMNELTAEQVSASFVTMGVPPLADPELIARAVATQLQMTSQLFAQNAFDAEPATFLVELVRETK
jgi:hypothetical protein